jgi:hypothetical protein
LICPAVLDVLPDAASPIASTPQRRPKASAGPHSCRFDVFQVFDLVAWCGCVLVASESPAGSALSPMHPPAAVVPKRCPVCRVIARFPSNSEFIIDVALDLAVSLCREGDETWTQALFSPVLKFIGVNGDDGELFSPSWCVVPCPLVHFAAVCLCRTRTLKLNTVEFVYRYHPLLAYRLLNLLLPYPRHQVWHGYHIRLQ